MNILVFNVGSTTLKFACIELPSGARVSEGLVDRIGQHGGDATDHLSAARLAIEQHAHLDIAAFGHRVVQGGTLFTHPTLVTGNVLNQLKTLDSLAPLHNPSARAVIEFITGSDLAVSQVLVFDTAYFATLPPHAYRYAVPDWAYRDHAVRRYGAHGTSHQFVTNKAIRFLRVKAAPHPTRIVSLHLGGGASATASLDGIAIDTSMGMTPLEGLVMATRTGDIDPAAVLHLMRRTGRSIDQMEHLLNKESGLKGLCGEVDMRAILLRRDQGDPVARLAIDVYVHRLVKTIGGYAAIMGGIDALVFTAGVGENAAVIRELVTAPLAHLGIHLDQALNQQTVAQDQSVDISQPAATARTLVVPTDEEFAIASQVQDRLGS